MGLLLQILVGIIAFLHLYFLWFEMFAWQSMGKKLFRHLSADFLKDSKAMAANQGLYNGFLAAGLIWTFFISNPDWQFNVTLFFLSCVTVAGLYGGFSVGKKIIYIQALPAILAIVVLVLNHLR
ncbi:MAG: DUF1304 domain-containing protein [Putridiphycobacter sp.]